MSCSPTHACVLQASDAGAHLDMMCGAAYPTEVLAELVRERGLFTLEEMVHQLSGAPAALVRTVRARPDRTRRTRRPRGVRARRHRAHADADPPRPPRRRRTTALRRHRHDRRLGERTGVGEDAFTGVRPGRLLRSGRDSTTVTAGELTSRSRGWGLRFDLPHRCDDRRAFAACDFFPDLEAVAGVERDVLGVRSSRGTRGHPLRRSGRGRD